MYTPKINKTSNRLMAEKRDASQRGSAEATQRQLAQPVQVPFLDLESFAKNQNPDLKYATFEAKEDYSARSAKVQQQKASVENLLKWGKQKELTRQIVAI